MAEQDFRQYLGRDTFSKEETNLGERDVHDINCINFFKNL